MDTSIRVTREDIAAAVAYRTLNCDSNRFFNMILMWILPGSVCIMAFFSLSHNLQVIWRSIGTIYNYSFLVPRAAVALAVMVGAGWLVKTGVLGRLLGEYLARKKAGELQFSESHHISLDEEDGLRVSLDDEHYYCLWSIREVGATRSHIFLYMDDGKAVPVARKQVGDNGYDRILRYLASEKIRMMEPMPGFGKFLRQAWKAYTEI